MLIVATLSLTGCGASSTQQVSVGSWIVPVSQDYDYQYIHPGDIGSSVTDSRAMLGSGDATGQSLAIIQLEHRFADSRSLATAALASASRQLGFRLLQERTVQTECEQLGEVSMALWQIQPSPLSPELYYVMQGYLVDADQSAIVSLVSRDKSSAKELRGVMQQVDC